MTRKDILDPDEREVLLGALRRIREIVQWKVGKGQAHLNKRLQMGHLPLSASLVEYDKTILHLVRNGQNVI